MWQGRLPLVRRALLIVAVALPFSQTAIAVDIYYARAIGDAYGYRPPPASEGNATSAPADARDPALPGLGTESPAASGAQGSSIWSRILVGALIIGGMAALASSGADGEVSAGVDIGVGGGNPSTGASGGNDNIASSDAPNGSASDKKGKSDNGKGKDKNKNGKRKK